MADPNSPIGVIDSGVGGLTVLAELLTGLPNEDYVYVGDDARFPFGERTQGELKQFARELTDQMLGAGVKLVVVACNSLSAAALNSLQAHLEATGSDVDVVGAVAGAVQAAVSVSRSGRIGLLATRATVLSRAYESALRRTDDHVSLESVACPGMAAALQRPEPFDATLSELIGDCCAPLRTAEVDTVILGAAHFPRAAAMLSRELGPGVALVSSGPGLVRAVRRALAARQLLNPRAGAGSYRLCCTGEPDAFGAAGAAFLPLALGRIQHVTLNSGGPVAA